jgi:AcrR family transcriptional regulator
MRSKDGVVNSTVSPWQALREQDRERRREDKRDAVILAAARAFRERGYHNTSLDDVAALLHVTKPTLYYYVANKEEMLFECFRAGLDRIAAVFTELREHKATGRERLLAVIRRYAEAITSEFGWCMVRAEDQDLSPEMSARIKALKSGIDQGIRGLIKEGIEDGSIRACDPKITAFALAGALNWIAHWYRESDQLAASEIADRFVETFENGLRPHPGGEPSMPV